MKKITSFLFLLTTTLTTALAQTYKFVAEPEMELKNGKYAIWAKNKSGGVQSGFVNGSRAIATSASFNADDVVGADYVWELTLSEDGTTFTLKNLSTSNYFVARGHMGNAWGTMSGNEAANLKTTEVTIDDVDYFALSQTNYTFSKTDAATYGDVAYIHTNQTNLSWWSSYSADFNGSNVKFLFYPLNEASPIEAAKAELQAVLDRYDAFVWDVIGGYTPTDEVKAAKSAADEAIEGSDVGAVNAAKTTLEEAIAKLTLILPEAGKFYTFIGSSGNYLTGQTSTSNGSRAKMCPESGYDASYVVYYTGSKLVSFSTGLGLSSAAKFANIGDAASDVTFVNTHGAHTAVAGKLCVMIGTHNIHDWSVGDASTPNHAGINGSFDASSDWTISEVTTLPLAISEAGYASFYAPVAVTMPAGLEAYVVESISGDVAMLSAVESVVPANTGVILKGTAGNYELDITESNESNEVVANELTGTVASAYVAGPAYVLSQPEGKEVGFYAALLNKNSEGAAATEGGTHFLANGFKAYLPAEGAASARLLFDFGTETAIESIQGAESANAVVYDLAGRRVQNAQKGLYIVNGKKVVK